MSALLVGYGLGFAVALQVGPLSLLAIRSTLRSGLPVGLAIGAAVALVDTLYAAAGAAGAAGLLSLEPLRLGLGILGAVVLAVIGARTLWSAFRVRIGGESDAEVGRPGRAFATAFAACASNPLTIASWAAIFAAASTAGAARDGGTLALLGGVGLGSLSWMCVLATGVAAARHSIGERAIRVVDAVAGAGLLLFGGALAWRTLREP
jgi:putative LysE/RhtB family amino acid efflux pump